MVALDHVEPHRVAVLHHLVDDRLELRELVDVVAVRLGLAFHRRRAVGVGLQPHHLGLGAGPQVQPGLLGELVVDPSEVAAAVRRQERAAVDLLLAAPEQRAEDPRGLAIPGQHAEGLDVGDADELPGLRTVPDVVAETVDEQVGGRPVDELEALVGDRLPVLGRDALAHDAPGDGDELVVHVRHALGLDLPADLLDRIVTPGALHELLDVGGQLTPPFERPCRGPAGRILRRAPRPALRADPSPRRAGGGYPHAAPEQPTGPTGGACSEERAGDRAGGRPSSDHRRRRRRRDPRERARAVRPVQGEDLALDPRSAGRPARRQARHHHGHHADEGGRGQDDHVDLARAGHGEDREGRDALPPRAVDGSRLRDQRRRQRRRLRPGRPDGGDQPPLQRRLPRRTGGPQPPGGRPGCLDLPRERARDRPGLGDLAPDPRRQRPRAPLRGGGARGQGARRPAGEPVRDRGRLRDHGRARALERPRRPPRAARPRSSWPPRTTGHRSRPKRCGSPVRWRSS